MNFRHSLSMSAIAAGVAAALGLDIQVAYAQDNLLEEIVVTARRRNESF